MIWTYEDPFEAVAQIGGHVAFYADRAEVTVEEALSRAALRLEPMLERAGFAVEDASYGASVYAAYTCVR